MRNPAGLRRFPCPHLSFWWIFWAQMRREWGWKACTEGGPCTWSVKKIEQYFKFRILTSQILVLIFWRSGSYHCGIWSFTWLCWLPCMDGRRCQEAEQAKKLNKIELIYKYDTGDCIWTKTNWSLCNSVLRGIAPERFIFSYDPRMGIWSDLATLEYDFAICMYEGSLFWFVSLSFFLRRSTTWQQSII